MDRQLAVAIESALGAGIMAARAVRGGDVAESYRVDLDDGRTVFAKTHRRAPPGFFSTEAAGLRWLGGAGAVPVPTVLSVDDGDGDDDGDDDDDDGDDDGDGGPNHLVLEWVDEGAPHASTEADLGRALADLHAAGASCFGREDRRTTGSRGLPNDPCSTWAEFYATRRLLPLADLAERAGALPDGAVDDLRRLAGRLEAVGGPPEPPARLHGDLWAGNRLVDTSGRSWLIDPAAHGGHREFDLALMRLFGGFGAACHAAYEERWPLAAGAAERVALHQIAPLVVHAIKFGGGYGPAARTAIARYL